MLSTLTEYDGMEFLLLATLRMDARLPAFTYSATLILRLPQQIYIDPRSSNPGIRFSLVDELAQISQPASIAFDSAISESCIRFFPLKGFTMEPPQPEFVSWTAIFWIGLNSLSSTD